jgi:signal transduction histidine kinase
MCPPDAGASGMLATETPASQPIVIVDCDPVVRSLMRDALEADGFPVIVAVDGVEAYGICLESEPALLLADAATPNMDGFALCRELRRQVSTRHIPILMALEGDSHGLIAQAYEAGATDFIAKPLISEILNHRVRYMLRDARVLADLRQSKADPARARERQPDTQSAPKGGDMAAGTEGDDRRTILIVDDDPVVRSLMRDTLEDEGFTVIEAEDGIAASELCERSVPMLIIADVVMPRMDGFELCRTLRQRPETAYVPILMATGLNDHDSISIAYDAGATDFISKPLNWLILNHRVRYMLRAARAFDDLRHTQDRLTTAKEAAEAANAAKSDFLANMSHELRTPLNAIIGFAEIMRDGLFGPINDKYADYAKIIGDSGSHLLGIINDILEIAKADAQGMELREGRVDIATIVSFAASIVDEMAIKAEIHCSFDVQNGMPLFQGDGKKLRQILINLLSNAIKFTPAGGSVSLTAAREADGRLIFRLADTGIGIPADKLAVALEPFGQVDSGRAREYNGVGLGLPLTKRLVELHGGTFDIASEPDKGTIVTVGFPADRFLAILSGSPAAAE